MAHRSSLRPLLGMAFLAAIAVLSGTLNVAQAATTLSIVVAGEPWKDPSLASVGTTLEVATPPGQIWLGWSTSATAVMGVTWQVSKDNKPVQSGKAPLPHAALPHVQNWISIPATFLAPQPPTPPVNYQITVTPYDAKGAPADTVSPAVTVTQKVDHTPPITFGRAAVFPQLELISFLPQIGGVQLTQLRFAIATVKVRAHNEGGTQTDAVLAYAKDQNGLMRQDTPVPIPSLPPHGSREVTFDLKAVLPPAQSQLPEDQQYTQWQRDYSEKCGVELRTGMDVDLRAPGAKMLMNTHQEVDLYKGVGSTLSISPVKPEVPLCDENNCVLMSDVANNIRKQLDGKVVGYAFFLAGCSIRSEAYGFAQTSADKQAGFTPDTKMEIASASKVITTLAAIRVIAERQKSDPNLKLGLNSPIGPFLPPWGQSVNVSSITFRRLLSQTSGVRNYGDFSNDYATLKKFFTKPMQAGAGAGPVCDPAVKDVDGVAAAIVTDQSWCYSNLNFAIFRILLPRIMGFRPEEDIPQGLPNTLIDFDAFYGPKYVQIVRDTVFGPLGITDVDCQPPAKAPYALGYTFPGTSSGQDHENMRGECGGKGWYVSVEDLGAVLLSLSGVDGRILDRAEFRDMEHNGAAPHGVGWDITSMNGGYRWLEKNGKLSGLVNSSIAVFGSKNVPDPTPKPGTYAPTPYFIPGGVGVLFINSDISGAPKGDASGILAQAVASSLKPKK